MFYIPEVAPWYKRRPVNWLKAEPTPVRYAATLPQTFNYVGPEALGPAYTTQAYPFVLGDSYYGLKTPLFNPTRTQFDLVLPATFTSPAMPLQNSTKEQSNLTLPANYMETV